MLIMLINDYLHYNRIRRRMSCSRGACEHSLFNIFYSCSRFGPPFLMREDRSISWDQLQQSILSKLYYLMINGAQAQVQAQEVIFLPLPPHIESHTDSKNHNL